MKNKNITRSLCDSYNSTKCVGIGNGRTTSNTTSKLRRQVNKKRRRLLLQDLRERIDNVL